MHLSGVSECLQCFGGPLGKGEAGREAGRPVAVGSCVIPQELPGNAATAAAPGQCSVPAEHPWGPLLGGKEPFGSQQSSLAFLGNDFGPTSQQVLLASLSKWKVRKTRPSARSHLWVCSSAACGFVLHHLPCTPSLGTEKPLQVLLTAGSCRDFHCFALVGSQDALGCSAGGKQAGTAAVLEQDFTGEE